MHSGGRQDVDGKGKGWLSWVLKNDEESSRQTTNTKGVCPWLRPGFIRGS